MVLKAATPRARYRRPRRCRRPSGSWRTRVNGTGNSGAQVQTQGNDQITVTVPGKAATSVVNLIDTTAKLAFRPVLLFEPYTGASTAPAKANGTATPSPTPSGSASSTATPATSPTPSVSSTPSATAKASTSDVSAKLASPTATPTSTASAKATTSTTAEGHATTSPTATATPSANPGADRPGDHYLR